MQLKHSHKRKIALGIAILFLLYGLLDWIFKFNISPSIVNNVSLVLMVIAFGFLYNKPKNKNTDQTQDSSSEYTTEETDMDNQVKDDSDEHNRNSSKNEAVTLIDANEDEQDTNANDNE